MMLLATANDFACTHSKFYSAGLDNLDQIIIDIHVLFMYIKTNMKEHHPCQYRNSTFNKDGYNSYIMKIKSQKKPDKIFIA